MGHSVPSNSVRPLFKVFFKNAKKLKFYRGPAAQRTQYAHRHEVSSPQRNMYGPYSKVKIEPNNRNNSEEGLPFIMDPSNNDNFNDSARKFEKNKTLSQIAIYLNIQLTVNSDMCKV